MITGMVFLAEIISIIYSLHLLYGEKFRLEIKTISLICIDIIFLQMIAEFHWSNSLTLLLHPIIWCYCLIRFGTDIKRLIINNITYIILLTCIQFMGVILLEFVKIPFPDESYRNLFINILVLCVTFFVLPKLKLHELSIYLQKRETIIWLGMIGSTIVIFVLLFQIKSSGGIEIRRFLLFIPFIIIIQVLSYSQQKYKLKAMEQNMELKMHELYDDSYSELIKSIRARQHDFKMHIHAIHSMHYTCKTYEELVQKQKEYCEQILEDNKFNKLLTEGNSIIIGFLYGKFISLEKNGVELEYHIRFEETQMGLPSYCLVEILGNLLDNALEESTKQSDKRYRKIFFSLNSDNNVELIIRNRTEYVSYKKIEEMFEAGKSSKGKHRGMGLYRVKKLCEEYKCDLVCHNQIVDEENWLEFRIIIKDSTREETK